MSLKLRVWQRMRSAPSAESIRLIQRPRILLVEADPLLRQRMSSALQNDGYEVVEIADGVGLLERIGSEPSQALPIPAPDAVIFDVGLQDCSGLEVLAGLRRAPWRAPVILIAGPDEALAPGRAREMGAVAVFDRGFEIDDLLSVVLNVVRPM